MSYRQGQSVFTDRSDMRGAWERMRLPAMSDFVDDTFLASHCFNDDITDAGEYTVHFQPLDSLSVPDVDGTVTLDSATFVVRRVAVHLTQASKVAPGFERLEVQTVYREILPRIAIPAEIVAVQRFRVLMPDERWLVATERQILRTLRFLSQPPRNAPGEQTFALPQSSNAR
jgi:hypothetical protein